MTDKKELRKIIRERKKLLSSEEKWKEKESVFQKIEDLSVFKEASKIVCYWSLPDELDTHDFVEKWYSSKSIYLPRVIGEEVELVLFEGNARMIKGAYGIQEPKGRALEKADDMDLIIVPGIAFTKEGLRMGRGGGYYDRLLPQLGKIWKIGVGYNCQMVKSLPVEEHDVKMDLIVQSS